MPESSENIKNKIHSLSNDVIPQTITMIRHPLPLPNLSNVGFQSIFQNPSLRRSRQSLLSNNLNLNISSSPYSFSNIPFHDNKSMIDQTSHDDDNDGTNFSIHESLTKPKHSFKMKAKRFLSTSWINGDNKSPTIDSSGKNSLSKLIRSYSHHKAYTSGPISDSNKSVYSFNPSLISNINDPYSKTVEYTDVDTDEIHMLHDLIKNLANLESTQKSLTIQEKESLLHNIWIILTSTIISLFKIERLWQLPAKIEDINRIFDFYITLYLTLNLSSNQLLMEIDEFLITSMYILENQVVLNYDNKEIINITLKRLSVIWNIFHQFIYYDVIAILCPLEISFKKYQNFWINTDAPNTTFNLETILLRNFRDSIVLPYYQNFLLIDDKISRGFQIYINQEEENDYITQTDKLILLQCFGLLSSIQSNDMNQQIIEELLVGVRMSI